MRPFKFVPALFILLAILIAGCASNRELTATDTTAPVLESSPVLPSVTSTHTVTITPSPTATLTPTQTPKPSTPTASPTPVPLTDTPTTGNPTGSPTATPQPFRVINVPPGEVLVVHSGAGDEHLVMGTIPHDGRDIYPLGQRELVGHVEWVLIRYGEIIGWVRSSNLTEQ